MRHFLPPPPPPASHCLNILEPTHLLSEQSDLTVLTRSLIYKLPSPLARHDKSGTRAFSHSSRRERKVSIAKRSRHGSTAVSEQEGNECRSFWPWETEHKTLQMKYLSWKKASNRIADSLPVSIFKQRLKSEVEGNTFLLGSSLKENRRGYKKPCIHQNQKQAPRFCLGEKF